MHVRITHLFAVVFLLVCASCGNEMQRPIDGMKVGGTEAGNPDTMRTVEGLVPLSAPAAGDEVADADTAPCAADTVIASDGKGVTRSETIDERCHFSITLPMAHSYCLRVARKGRVIGVIALQASAPTDGPTHLHVGVVSMRSHATEQDAASNADADAETTKDAPEKFPDDWEETDVSCSV